MKTILGFCVALMVMAFPARAGLVYDVVTCTMGVSCGIGSHGSSSGMGPSEDDFRTFFAAQFGFDLSSDSFTWTEASNANGYTFGHVDDALFSMHTAYLWNGSSLLCCMLDDPYEIVDGNDHNMFVGNDAYFFSNAGQPVYPGFLAGVGGTLGLPPLAYDLTTAAWDYLSANSYPPITFVAIDNDNVILARWDTNWLKFVPAAEPNPAVPEPASALLLLPALALLRRFKRR